MKAVIPSIQPANITEGSVWSAKSLMAEGCGQVRSKCEGCGTVNTDSKHHIRLWVVREKYEGCGTVNSASKHYIRVWVVREK